MSNKIPKLPGGVFGYMERANKEAFKRAKQGMRPVNPATMDPKLKAFLKRAGLL